MDPAAGTGRAAGDRGARIVVWAVWAAMTVAAFAYTARFASDMPQWDEDQYVPLLAGERPFSVAWLFERHADHVTALPKALWLACVATTRDFRAGALLSGAATSAAVALLLVTARRLRGRTDHADVFLPLATLHWGRAGNLLWSEQLPYTCSSVLQAVLLAAMLRTDRAITTRTAVLVGSCLLLLPLCGGQGLVLVPALALWLLLAARGERGSRRILVAAAGAVPLAVAVAIGVSGEPAQEMIAHEPARVAAVALQVTGLAAGPAGRFGWPGTLVGEGFPPLVSLGVALAFVATVVLLAVAVRRRPDERLCAAALLAHCAALATLALAIGVGRGAVEESAGLQDRYVTAALPLAWVVFFAWERFAEGRARRVARATLVAAAALLVPFHTFVGVVVGRDRHARMEAAAEALSSGEPREAVALRFSPFLHPDPAELARQFELLERAGLGPFRGAGTR